MVIGYVLQVRLAKGLMAVFRCDLNAVIDSNCLVRALMRSWTVARRKKRLRTVVDGYSCSREVAPDIFHRTVTELRVDSTRWPRVALLAEKSFYTR